MKYRKLGNSNIEASVIAFGAWAIGGWMWGGSDEKEAIDSIHGALDSGINFFDTAPIYGFGKSEEIIGKAVKGRRDKIIIATKCGLVWNIESGKYYFSSDINTIKSDSGSMKVYKYLGKDSIRKEIENSLSRLKTDYIDLYQTHWPDSTTPIEETMEELNKLKIEGKIRAIGCSNVNTKQMDIYRSVGTLDSDQEKYSLLDRKLESKNIKYCKDNNIAFLAYSPLSSGLLTGKITPERKFPEGDLRYSNTKFAKGNRKRIIEKLKTLDNLKEKYNATYSQLVLAWTYEQEGCSHVLAGARNKSQSIENAKAGKIDLSKDDINLINNIF